MTPVFANVLQPLGFEIHQAASGHACLAMLAGSDGVEPLQPDAILMDLAMPGIDGWATIRAIRTQGLSAAPIAIVSGNAFDKNLDNDVGIQPEDFVVKPVRVSELLDWLGTRLRLQWTEAPRAVDVPAPAPAVPWVLPPHDQLRDLQELIHLGYFRGIVKKLDEIEGENAASARFVTHLRGLARNFQLDAMTAIVRQALEPADASPPSP